MSSFGDLPVNDAIALYYEKHDAAKHGNLVKLRQLRNDYPELFQKETDQEMQAMLNYVSELRRDPIFQARYQAFCKEEAGIAKTLTLIKK